jgi:hypothetical protein
MIAVINGTPKEVVQIAGEVRVVGEATWDDLKTWETGRVRSTGRTDADFLRKLWVASTGLSAGAVIAFMLV